MEHMCCSEFTYTARSAVTDPRRLSSDRRKRRKKRMETNDYVILLFQNQGFGKRKAPPGLKKPGFVLSS
jgi:hypothetical protein